MMTVEEATEAAKFAIEAARCDDYELEALISGVAEPSDEDEDSDAAVNLRVRLEDFAAELESFNEDQRAHIRAILCFVYEYGVGRV